ncbi:AmmeMemoRadiSam system protein A [bacterium]|nr:AmmeMemoRadiSam system protein A [bacterium]
MINLNENDKQWLLQLSRETITQSFKNRSAEPQNIPDIFYDKMGTFVTLKKNGDLRGCIGYLIPQKMIYQDVIDNSINSAFYDNRFSPLLKTELELIKIEISILTPPTQFEYTTKEEIIYKMDEKPGVILKNGARSATFLPQVWEQLTTPIAFLTNLSLKAGLSPDSWQYSEIFTYKNIHFSEN